ncbi:MAG: hypothetical protein QCI38_01740 [Candidatus Thermoplasmatota archaeon]|nr:hypothetical protein [Candidatus Thermoplasmatota archaeon]
MIAMKAIVQLLLVVLVAALLLVPSLAFAGSEDDPEIVDPAGDSKGENFQDIIKGWVENEQVDSFDLVLQFAGSPRPWVQGYLQSDRPVFNYEFYFSFNNTNYAAVGVVQNAVSGPFGQESIVLVDGVLRQITYYPSEDNILEEENIGTVSASWDSARTSLVFRVAKSAIGSPQPEEYITNLWAAVWNNEEKPFDDERFIDDALDSAMSFHNPGRDYMFTGGLTNTYEIAVSGPASYEVESNQSVVVNITVSFSTDITENTTFNVTLSSTVVGLGQASLGANRLTFNGSGSKNVVLTYTAPSVINTTNATVTINAVLQVTESGTTTTFTDSHVVTMNILPAEPSDVVEEEEGFFAFLMSPTGLMLIGGIAAILVLLIILVAVKKKRRKRSGL